VDVRTLPDLIETRADEYGDDTVLTEAETGAELTYAELRSRANDVAAHLHAIGIGRDSKVAAVLPNSIDLVVAIAGVLKAGAVAVPINCEYTGSEMAYILDRSDSEAIISSRAYDDTVSTATDGLDSPDILHLDEIEDGARDVGLPDITPVDTAIIMFTSGTTGDPKGVEHSHHGLLLRFDGGELLRSYDVFYTLLPLYNIDGFLTTFGTVYNGGRVLLRDGFSASRFWADVEAYGAQLTSCVPSILAILLEVGKPSDTDISSFEVFLVSGSYVHEELVETFESTFDVEVMEVYGLTEAAGTTYGDPTEMVPGSAGSPVDYSELSVVDEDTREELPPGEIGEIRIRGPTVFKQYYKNESATTDVFEGPWFKTGDLGYVDEAGRYYVLDRIKNIIIRGGQNIYPAEIEEIIHDVDHVEDVTVVGADHDIYGEVPVAYITTGPDANPDDVIEAVEAVCGERLAAFKQPEEIRHLDAFPRGETGKILQSEL
jgi:acyl-CoA synthetase (AMP-forming)/AMP-acid ligase II